MVDKSRLWRGFSKCRLTRNLRVTIEKFPGVHPTVIICPLLQHHSLIVKIPQSVRQESKDMLKVWTNQKTEYETEKFPGVHPMGLLWTLGWHDYPEITITQSDKKIPLSIETGREGGWGRLVPLIISIIWFFEKFGVLSPKPIWVFRILEYAIISLLNYL